MTSPVPDLQSAGVVCEAEREGLFPWSFAEELLQLIKDRQLNVLRYADLPPSSLRKPARFRYIDEYVAANGFNFNLSGVSRSLVKLIRFRLAGRLPFYEQLLRKHANLSQKATIFLEHDADLLPERTYAMMALEERFGFRSSNYFFVEHAEIDDYELDVARLQQFENRGFEIGYHQNAFERSGYDVDTALQLAERDLAELNRHFSIRSFVPHGGIPSAGNLNNRHLPNRGALQTLLWAYNGNCILKEFVWSDGGIRKETKTDPREFVRKLPNGTRATMLIHPQYYSDKLRSDWKTLPIAREPWWRELWAMD